MLFTSMHQVKPKREFCLPSIVCVWILVDFSRAIALLKDGAQLCSSQIKLNNNMAAQLFRNCVIAIVCFGLLSISRAGILL